MSLEQSETNINSQPTSSGQQADLSRSIFSNKEDFLSTLHQDMVSIQKHGAGNVTQQDLIDFSNTPGLDAKERAAAQIASNHYDDLKAMSKFPGSDDVPNADSIQTISDLYEGKVGSYLLKEEAKDIIGTGLSAAAALYAGAQGIAFIVVPPISCLLGATAFGLGYLSASFASKAYNAPSQFRDSANLDQKLLNQWSELNVPAKS